MKYYILPDKTLIDLDKVSIIYPIKENQDESFDGGIYNFKFFFKIICDGLPIIVKQGLTGDRTTREEIKKIRNDLIRILEINTTSYKKL